MHLINWQNGIPAQFFLHLERANIQRLTIPIQYTSVHWQLLKFEFRLNNWQEVAGQLPRLLVGGVKSFIGKIPAGNTGGANVPALLPMEIPSDLKEVLKQHSANEYGSAR